MSERSPQDRSEAGHLTVLTINLWADNGPADRRIADLARYVGRVRPDIIAMQEVAGPSDRTQAHDLAAAAGYDVINAAWTGRLKVRGEGLAVASRLAGRAVDLVGLPGRIADLARACQIVDIVTPDGAVVRVANTHLAWRLGDTELRVEQADAITRTLEGWTGPCLVAGDLNDTPTSAPLERFRSVGFVDAYAAARAEERWTFHPDNPYVTQPELVRRRVDHVLVRGSTPSSARVVLDGEDGPVVSDHYGVLVDLDLRSAEPHA